MKTTGRNFVKLRIAIATLSLAILTIVPGSAQEPVLKQTKAVAAVEKEKASAEKPQPLTENEQSELARRSEEPGKEVAGGALSNLHLTYIVIALATAVLVLVLK
jgi:hypothetical protein